MSRILLTGGSGLLGKELLKINSSIIAPSSTEMDIVLDFDVNYEIQNCKPDIVIHCAALLDDKTINSKPHHAIMTNIIGTANVAMVCSRMGIRLVYLSTDYIYKGDRGDYKEEDEILPYNFYSWTKLGGECAVRGVKNHLIIRTSFGASKFPYKTAFSDRWRSKDYVDVIAPMIYEAAIGDIQGVLNIGTDRKTMYSYARGRNKDVQPVRVEDSGFDAPYDTSFNLDKWNKWKQK